MVAILGIGGIFLLETTIQNGVAEMTEKQNKKTIKPNDLKSQKW